MSTRKIRPIRAWVVYGKSRKIVRIRTYYVMLAIVTFFAFGLVAGKLL